MKNRLSTRAMVFTLAGLLLCFYNAHSQTSIHRLHSLFMYNFTKHVQWQSVEDPFTIGVYGSDIALKEVKANFVNKKYNGQEIRVINVAGLGDVKKSHIVYMPKSNKSRILNLFEDSDKTNTLFVSEDDLIEYGFPISFVIRQSKLTFMVSKQNVEAAGLKISGSLLSLGEVVD
jgi:hypothetical protein